MLVALKTQELAGLDLISDGELGRFDPAHPETNGMVEYFTRRLAGMAGSLTRAELVEFRAGGELAFRAAPGGIVHGPVGPGTLDLPSAWANVTGLTTVPLKCTVTSPYMLAATVADRHYGDRRALAAAIAEVLAEQVAAVDVKDLEIETPDTVARRIGAAVEALGADAVRWVHPDCGLWMLPRPVADGKLRALVAGRDLAEGRR
jgi:5-methyltetrahydropteroyltriglutamate--homocysteine methyltransferase